VKWISRQPNKQNLKDILLRKNFPWLLAVISGVIGFLGYVGFNQFYLEWFFLVPLLWAVRDETSGRAFLLGWVAGIAAHAGGCYWFYHTLSEFVGLNPVFSGIGLFLFAAFNGLSFAIFAWAINRLHEKKGWSVWWTAPVVWTAIENIYPFIFPNYLGASQYMLLPLIQIADITGILGISFLVVWCNATVYMVLESRITRRQLPVLKPVVFFCVIAMIFVYGRARIKTMDAAMARAPKINVAVVQAGEGGIAKHKDPGQFVKLHETLTKTAVNSDTAKNTDLVIWPEAVITRPFSREPDLLPEKLFDTVGKPVLFGAYTAEQKDGIMKQYVSAVLLDAELKMLGVYDKQVLVPFGEYIPLGDALPVLYQALPYTTRFWPGENIAPLEFKDYRLQVNICYEDIFPNLIHQNMIVSALFGQGIPHAIINLTNDSWYGDTFEPLQHLVNAGFRAIEHRRCLVRSTNTGISAIVDPVGRIEKRTGQWTQEVLTGDVPMMTGRTIFSRVGNWLGACATLISLLLIGLTFKSSGPGSKAVSEP
jgi:apolipoprotein N-acyltransferase